ncbi:uncharacterized protein PAC_11836 [Phialocephala subalpina]|uniref:Uncharacterized protein n=1 Tax=Phialocephala subalpina TaxID=576137 RepID=A0A1L7XA91_9HELO|nr:uncharacterized protein PAC_11836 [Phialocephala subalpina]
MSPRCAFYVASAAVIKKGLAPVLNNLGSSPGAVADPASGEWEVPSEATSINLNQPEWSLETRIKRSIEAIQKEHGVGGIFQVLLWAVTLNFSEAETAFWRDVEKGASSKLGDENYPVLFEGCGQEFNETCGGSTDLGESPSIIDGECFYLLRAPNGDFESIPYGEGLARLWSQRD